MYKLTKQDREVLKYLEQKPSISPVGALHFFAGEHLGTGNNRAVYALKKYPEYVMKLKLETQANDFSNVKEWLIWDELCMSDLHKWFAPCLTMNETGTVLFQKRATIGRRKDYPYRLPSFFTDLKIQNFGFIGDQFVCFDYGSSVILTKFMDEKKTRVAKWWSLSPRQLKQHAKNPAK